jgi:hypothetical protein
VCWCTQACAARSARLAELSRLLPSRYLIAHLYQINPQWQTLAADTAKAEGVALQKFDKGQTKVFFPLTVCTIERLLKRTLADDAAAKVAEAAKTAEPFVGQMELAVGLRLFTLTLSGKSARNEDPAEEESASPSSPQSRSMRRRSTSPLNRKMSLHRHSVLSRPEDTISASSAFAPGLAHFIDPVAPAADWDGLLTLNMANLRVCPFASIVRRCFRALPSQKADRSLVCVHSSSANSRSSRPTSTT